MALLRWALLGLGLSACGGTILPPPDRPPVPPLTPSETAKEFGGALGELAAHDQAGDWTPATCSALAADFERIARGSKGDAKDNAWFNAGISHQRCGQHQAAEQAFRHSGSHRARAELILYRHAAGASLDGTIADLERVIREGAFQNVRALVAVASLQMERGADADLKAAHENLQRALAIDDAYSPAANQLALYYLSQAKTDAGTRAGDLVLAAEERPHAKRQQVDLAALVISQALKKNDRYAPLHNTAGLVEVELSDYRAAAHSFQRARELDPSFFEAHMNYAALSFRIRGFARAESAYRDAVGLHPNDYDAHLGLSLAIRAQAHLGDTARIAEARRELATAQKLDPRRPEAYYNQAVLVQEYDAKSAPGKRAIPELRRAQKLYGEFAERAESTRSLADAVKRARERSADIEATIKFLEQGS